MEKEKFNKVYEYLNEKGVYELRNIGRALCVRAPTLYKKRELIEQIIENAVSGKVTACLGRGAPVKAERASLQTLSEIRKMKHYEWKQITYEMRNIGYGTVEFIDLIPLQLGSFFYDLRKNNDKNGYDLKVLTKPGKKCI